MQIEWRIKSSIYVKPKEKPKENNEKIRRNFLTRFEFSLLLIEEKSNLLYSKNAISAIRL